MAVLLSMRQLHGCMSCADCAVPLLCCALLHQSVATLPQDPNSNAPASADAAIAAKADHPVAEYRARGVFHVSSGCRIMACWSSTCSTACLQLVQLHRPAELDSKRL